MIEVLEERFGFVPTYLKDRIKSINNRLYLKELLRYAIRASSLEEFETRYLQQGK
ncbi:MAG: hypothetical protein N3A62_06100 [Thermodesulfovibrionales bacterium]|nr:hypothetical protein [Thermodesulfovibrionales bacterium]